MIGELWQKPISLIPLKMRFFVATFICGWRTSRSWRRRWHFARSFWRARAWILRAGAHPQRFYYAESWPVTDDPQLPNTICSYLRRTCWRAPTPYGTGLGLSVFLDDMALLHAAFSLAELDEVIAKVVDVISWAQTNWAGEEGHELLAMVIPYGALIFDLPLRPLGPTPTA